MAKTVVARPASDGIDWSLLIGLVVLHAGALLAFVPRFFTWDALLVGVVLFWLTGSIGISVTYHRLLTHGSFAVRPRWLEYVLTAIALLAAQRGPIRWVADHRRHHRYSDEDHDPHSPRNGFFWAHVMWLVTPDTDARDLKAYYQRWAPDLYKDPVLRWMDRYALLFPIAAGVILYAIGGMPWLVWGLFVRTVALLHTTYLVNSATHSWGYRNYETRDTSTNLWWVGLLAHGEGWHNNHHAFQSSANFGHRWWEVDLSFWVIRLLSWVGIAYQVKTPKYSLADRLKAPKLAEQAEPQPAVTLVAAEG